MPSLFCVCCLSCFSVTLAPHTAASFVLYVSVVLCTDGSDFLRILKSLKCNFGQGNAASSFSGMSTVGAELTVLGSEPNVLSFSEEWP